MMSAAIPEQGNGKTANPLPRAVDVIDTRATAEAKTTEQGLDTPIAGNGAQPSDNNYSLAIRGLIDLYSDVENSSFSLPVFSALPLGVFLWFFVKFEIAIIGDLFLFIPINFIIFIRNIFPGRWRYRRVVEIY
jgi:hypothetical protein